MGSFPIVYHLGRLALTAYGIGLALTFWFAITYTGRRLRRAGIDAAWLPAAALWVIGASLVGARLADVAADAGYYSRHLAELLAVWHGGLSSFGGLALGVPAALWLARRHLPGVSLLRLGDVTVPALVATWAVGRLLACQFEVGGGGPPTTAWYGLSYAGEVGRRVPVPLFQSAEDWAVFALLIWLGPRLARRAGRSGAVLAAGAGLWGLGRFFDQLLWFSRGGGIGASLTEAGGLALAVVGLVGTAWPLLHRPSPAPSATLLACAGKPAHLPAMVAPPREAGVGGAVARSDDAGPERLGTPRAALDRVVPVPTEDLAGSWDQS
jgi:phosphatidylglycerol:prolipoprotein diacylglycerol transferase